MDIRYRIIGRDGKIIFCNLYPKETDLLKNITSVSKQIKSLNLRAGLFSSIDGDVYVFSSSKDYVRSSTKFNTSANVILNAIGMINGVVKDASKIINQNTSRLIHNLTSLNAHNIQEIYSLIPQEKVSSATGSKISFVEDIVKNDPKEAALSLLRIAKNNAAMKSEFSVFKKLFDSNPDLQTREHNVHKVLMNIFYLFFPDFTDKEVKVKVGDNKNTYMAYFDYESFHVALYHILENAAKYTKPKSRLTVEIKNVDNFIEIEFDMISLEIKKNETNRIFEEGVSGELASRIGKAGDGIGMNRAKRILELNYGSISVVPHNNTLETVMGVAYQKNVFIIKLPKNRVTQSSYKNHT